jgi:hypothetical protein
LSVLRISVAAEHECILFSDHLRIQENDSIRIIHAVVEPYVQLGRKSMFRLDLPRSAIWSEVARVCARFDEQKSLTGDCLYQIKVMSRPINDVSRGPVRRDNLFWIPAEGKNTQRDTVIIDAVATAHDRPAFFEGLPGNSHPRSEPQGMREILAFQADSKIKG